MRVVAITTPGGPEVLKVVERPAPAPGPAEVVVRVVAAGVNRPDVQQRRGLYPPPENASDIPGLDICGIVESAGEGVSRPRPGEAVCALANGGGYADFCAVPAVQCMPVPKGMSFIEAASLPEVFFTVWNTVIWLGRLAHGESMLVQGGTSGVGMAAIQIARKLRQATVYATAGTSEKRAVCLEIGAHAALDYKTAWEDEIRRLTQDRGVDLVLDAQAGPQTQRQLNILAPDGRLVFLASHQAETAEVNIRALVRRRLTITGATLRPRPPEYKGLVADELVRHVWPLLENGEIVTRIHATLPLKEVAEAHRILDANLQIGKVVLVMDEQKAGTIPIAR